MQGKLRIGLGAETVLVALAHAVLLHNSKEKVKSEDLANHLEKASQAVKLAYSQCPSYDKLVPALLQYPVEVGCSCLSLSGVSWSTLSRWECPLVFSRPHIKMLHI